MRQQLRDIISLQQSRKDYASYFAVEVANSKADWLENSNQIAFRKNLWSDLSIDNETFLTEFRNYLASKNPNGLPSDTQSHEIPQKIDQTQEPSINPEPTDAKINSVPSPQELPHAPENEYEDRHQEPLMPPTNSPSTKQPTPITTPISRQRAQEEDPMVMLPGGALVNQRTHDIGDVRPNGDGTYTITDMTGRIYDYPPRYTPGEACTIS